MQYRSFINKGNKVSLLGYGCMRLPVIDNDDSKIDYEKSSELLNHAIANGINYIDTAYFYHGQQSEIFLGEYFKKYGNRKDIYLATKNPVWEVKEHSDFEKFLDTQLERLNTSFIDFYLLHALDKNRWDKCLELNVFEFLEKAKEEEKIKYIGFSFHDDLDVFKEIIDSYDFDFCQIQLNYLDENYQAGLEGMRYAKEKGVSVVIMEPVKGGRLANLPNDITQPLKDIDSSKSNAYWALSWLINQSEISVILSEMNSLEQIDDNINACNEIRPNTLTAEELSAINKTKDNLNDKLKIDCTNCKYCLPCPSGVAIPDVFSYYNNMYVFNEADRSKKSYQNLLKKNSDAAQCIECGQCEEECPQHLPIIKTLVEAHNDLV